MRKYSKLLLPALVVGGVLFTPNVAEAKVSYNGAEYDTLKAAITAAGDAQEATFTLTSDTESGGAQIPVGVNYTIDGDGNVLKGGVKVLVDAPSDETTTLTIDNVVMDGGGSGTAISSDASKQKSGQTPSKLDLTITNSTIQNFGNTNDGSKAMYINNAQKALIDNVTFKDNESENYAIDFNLIGVKDADITVSNSTFTGTNAKTWLVKVAQRCGEGDNPGDITCNDDIRATVKKFVVDNNTFDSTTSMGQVMIGASAAPDYSDEFPVIVKANDGNDVVVATNDTFLGFGFPKKFNVPAGQSGTLIPTTDDKATFSTETTEPTALEVGKTFTPDMYLQTSAGRVELADVLNPAELTFTSSDDKVATVDDKGVVTAVAGGEATITATYGGQKLEWTVTVKESLDPTPSVDDDKPADTGDTETTEPVENVENPQTYDGSMIFIIAGIISALGLAGAGIGLGRESE